MHPARLLDTHPVQDGVMQLFAGWRVDILATPFQHGSVAAQEVLRP